MNGIDAALFLRGGRCARAVLLCAALCGAGCSQESGDTDAVESSRDRAGMTSTAPVTARSMPAEYQEGKARFEAFCARCHGKTGGGTTAGPPLVHDIYEPSHHADAAFMRAAARGVRAHHWNFGDMPKVTGATPDDVVMIISYVRWLQREAGIS